MKMARLLLCLTLGYAPVYPQDLVVSPKLRQYLNLSDAQTADILRWNAKMAEQEANIEHAMEPATHEHRRKLEDDLQRQSSSCEKSIQERLTPVQRTALKKLQASTNQADLQVEARFLHLFDQSNKRSQSSEFGGAVQRGKEHISVKDSKEQGTPPHPQ